MIENEFFFFVGKIENVIAHEGVQRVERVEPKNRWEQRMKNASFQGVAFSEDSVAEVKAMLDEHAAGWGLKKEEKEADMQTIKLRPILKETTNRNKYSDT